MNISRRRFLAVGAAGAIALAAAGWLRGPHSPPSGIARRALDADGESILAAIAPVMLMGALPENEDARKQALQATMTALDAAVDGLPQFAKVELAQLFALLSLPPVRLTLARIPVPWAEASTAEIRAFLDRFRESSWTLQRAAYDALHQLIFAAWYGNPHAWPAIGYGGPPALSAPPA